MQFNVIFGQVARVVFDAVDSVQRGRRMPLNILECRVSKMVNSDACPRPTTGARAERASGTAGRRPG